MSLAELTSTHTVTIYSLSSSQDTHKQTVETLGTMLASKKCRMVPVAVKEDHEFDESAQNQKYQAYFSADHSLTLSKVIVWDSKVWRVRGVRNASGVSWMWVVDLEHDPRIELDAS